MSIPPLIRRSPRLIQPLPKAPLIIPAPPEIPASPAGNIVTYLTPIITIVVVIGMTLFFRSRETVISVGLAATLAFAGSFAALGVYVISWYTHRVKSRQREQSYRQLLDEIAQQLQKLLEKQRMVRLQMDPPSQQCLAQVQERHRALWARLPDDEDFLRLRIGIGQQPSTVEIMTPTPSDLKADPLVVAAQKLRTIYSHVEDIPICLPLREAGIIGIAGVRTNTTALTLTLLIQLATNHAYDVVRVALFYPVAEDEIWRWTRWLPHLWNEERSQRYLANDFITAERLANTLEQELQRRSLQQSAPMGGPSWIVVVADLALVERYPVFQRLVTSGPAYGFYVVCLGERIRSLPPECRLLAHLDISETRLIWPEPTLQAQQFTPDVLTQALPAQFATAMAPLRLQQSGVSAIPTLVSLFELLQAPTVEDLKVVERWQHSVSASYSLAAPIGMGSGNKPLLLDLHEQADGPNGLVAGMVGAGKSELLQTLVASLAVSFHPHRLAFVLIDYKGGSTFQPLAQLPHTMGVITNLQEVRLATRSLTSLRVAMERRQRLFDAAGVGHIDQYQRLYDQKRVDEPLPYLLVLVDEFAEMRDEQPELAGEFVRIARTGRALGVRLILAMQKSAGIVDDQIEANTRFRICLRVAQIEDSQAMIKRPDAAYLANRGRAYFQVGANQACIEFQVAWSGAVYDGASQSKSDPVRLVEIALDGSRHRLGVGKPVTNDAPLTQLQALATHLQQTASREGIERLPSLWLPPLPSRVYLAQLLLAANQTEALPAQATPWMAPIIGLLDEPNLRRQQPLRLDLGKQGHLLIYGAPGAGKTIFLQTLIMALVHEHTPDDVHLYILDYGGRRLQLFAKLPHVGGVLLPDEQERLVRLLRMLNVQLDERQRKMSRVAVTTLPAYQRVAGEKLPVLCLLLDNYSNFAELTQHRIEVYSMFTRLARDGGAYGIHLVVTANHATAVRFDLSSNFALVTVLPLAEQSDYTALVGRLADIVRPTVPGRGLLRGNPLLEFQTALPAQGETDVEYAAALRTMVMNIADAWTGKLATLVPVMPTLISLSTLLTHSSQAKGVLSLPLGLHVENLTPLVVDLSVTGNILIAGSLRSGKSTLLHTWLLAATQQLSPIELHIYILDSKRKRLQPLVQKVHIQAYTTSVQEADRILAELVRICRDRRTLLEQHGTSLTWPRILVAVEDLLDPFDDNISEQGKEQLAFLLRQSRGLDIHLLVTCAANDVVSKGWQEPIRTLREAQTGFMLGSSDDSVFNLRLPYAERNRLLSPGEGYYVERNLVYQVKVALPDV